jgi:hypothetical protein
MEEELARGQNEHKKSLLSITKSGSLVGERGKSGTRILESDTSLVAVEESSSAGNKEIVLGESAVATTVPKEQQVSTRDGAPRI